MLNKEALQKAEDLIKCQLGTLEDLPYELANTIANIYYKYFVSLLETSETKTSGGFIPNSMKQAVGTSSLENLLKEFITSHEQITSDVEAPYEHVLNLRGIDKTQKPNLYQSIVDFILDCLKYNIKNASIKFSFARMFERKKNKVDEIPNLIDLMSFDNDDEENSVKAEYHQQGKETPSSHQ
jgi:hypothetical protein